MVPSAKVAVRVTRSGGLTLFVECGNNLLHDIDECGEFSGFVFSYWSDGGAGRGGSSRVDENDAVP